MRLRMFENSRKRSKKVENGRELSKTVENSRDKTSKKAVSLQIHDFFIYLVAKMTIFDKVILIFLVAKMTIFDKVILTKFTNINSTVFDRSRPFSTVLRSVGVDERSMTVGIDFRMITKVF